MRKVIFCFSIVVFAFFLAGCQGGCGLERNLNDLNHWMNSSKEITHESNA